MKVRSTPLWGILFKMIVVCLVDTVSPKSHLRCIVTGRELKITGAGYIVRFCAKPPSLLHLQGSIKNAEKAGNGLVWAV